MASTIMKNWGDVSTILTSITLNATTAEKFSSAIDLVTNGYEGIHVTIDTTFDAAGTANVNANLYGSIDSTNWDDVALTALSITVSTAAPQQVSFIVRDIAYGRFGIAPSSADANVAVATIRYRPWNWKSD